MININTRSSGKLSLTLISLIIQPLLQPFLCITTLYMYYFYSNIF